MSTSPLALAGVSYSPNADGTLDVIDQDGNYIGNVAGSLSASPIAYTSSPFAMAGVTGVPQSTLDTGIVPQAQQQANVGQTIGQALSSVSNVILGGLAISRIPAGQIGQVTTGATTIGGKAVGGTTVTSTPGLSAISSGGLSSILLIGLVILGVVLLVKHKG